MRVPVIILSGSRRFLAGFSLNLSWLQRVRNTRKWRAVTMIITFRRDLHLKYVICNSSAVTLKFVAFWAKKNTAYYYKCMRLVWWTPLYFFVVCLHSSIGDDLERRFWERTFAWIWLVNSERRDQQVERDFLPWFSKYLTSDWSITEESRENEAWKSHANYWKSVTKITWKCWTQNLASDFA